MDAVKTGSLRAGTLQAVVVLECQFPIGGTAERYAYDVRGNTAVLLRDVDGAAWGGDWGGGPSSIHIRFAKRFLYVDTCEDSDRNKSEIGTNSLHGGKLVKVHLQIHRMRSP